MYSDSVSTPPLSTRSAAKFVSIFLKKLLSDYCRVRAKRPARTEDVSDEDGLAANARASKKVKNTSSTPAEAELVDEPKYVYIMCIH